MYHFIDALIPGVGGLLMLLAPGLFTKAQGDARAQALRRFRIIGAMLLGCAAIAAVNGASSARREAPPEVVPAAKR